MSLTYVGDAVLNDQHAFTTRYESGRGINRRTLENIVHYCNDNLVDQNDINYIASMIEAIAFANNFILFTPKNPKEAELRLVSLISEKLSVLKNLENWNDDIPNWRELAVFFGFSETALWSKTHMSETRLHNIFYDKDLERIASRLKEKLAPIDKVGCDELLLELGKYNPSRRQVELKKLFPTWQSYQEYEIKTFFGDPDSVHTSNWNSPRKRSLREATLFATQGFMDGNIEYTFDAFTGNVYKRDMTFVSGRIVWEIHHIDFDKTNNDINNLLWVMKMRDPITGTTSHLTNIDDPTRQQEYIVQGKLIKSALSHGHAPRCWSLENQIRYYKEMRDFFIRFLI